jgi:hypothetical protein
MALFLKIYHGPMSCEGTRSITSGHLWPIEKDGPIKSGHDDI